MIIEWGNMWDALGQTDLFCVTTSASLRSSYLVMGAGIAKEAKRRFPDLPERAGYLIRFSGRYYGLLSFQCGVHKIGLFQTKYYSHHGSDIYLIRDAVAELMREITRNGYKRVDLNFPGIGLGGLPIKTVWNVLSARIPDSVHVWVNDETQYKELLQLKGNT